MIQVMADQKAHGKKEKGSEKKGDGKEELRRFNPK
jgi:hypothetical protein